MDVMVGAAFSHVCTKTAVRLSSVGLPVHMHSISSVRHATQLRNSLHNRVVSVRANVDSTTDAPAATTTKRFRPGEQKGFVEEMRIRAMKLHTRDQAKEGEKEAEQKPLGKWEPTKEGYIQFLVDSKAVYDTLEEIVERASDPLYADFRNTGLERSKALQKDLEWFQSEGFSIPEPGHAGVTYAALLQELAENDPQAFLCHFYNVYFAHSAGGRMIGRKVSEMILNSRELEFYKWEGDLPQILAAVKEKLNEAAKDWSREQKDHCLNETEKSFKYSGSLLRVLVA